MSSVNRTLAWTAVWLLVPFIQDVHKSNTHLANDDENQPKELFRVSFVKDEEALKKIFETQNAVVTIHAAHSLYSTYTRPQLFDALFKAAVEKGEPIDCFFVDLALYDPFIEMLRTSGVEKERYDAGHSERGAILFLSRGKICGVFDRDTKKPIEVDVEISAIKKQIDVIFDSREGGK